MLSLWELAAPPCEARPPRSKGSALTTALTAESSPGRLTSPLSRSLSRVRFSAEAPKRKGACRPFRLSSSNRLPAVTFAAATPASFFYAEASKNAGTAVPTQTLFTTILVVKSACYPAHSNGSSSATMSGVITISSAFFSFASRSFLLIS